MLGKKNTIWKKNKMLLKIASEIEKSRKFGIVASKRICTQHTLDFEENDCLSNLSGIKIKNNFFYNGNKIW